MPKVRVIIEYSPEEMPVEHCLDTWDCQGQGCPYTKATCPHHLQYHAELLTCLGAERRKWREGLLDTSDIADVDPEFKLEIELIEGT